MAKLKICGIRSLEEIKELVTLDIDYFGCIFAKSPRQVNQEEAKKIVEIAHQHGKKVVGVFVNETIDKIQEIKLFTGIDIVQLHGDESPEYCKKLGGDIWKVFRVYDEIPDFKVYDTYIKYPLFDTKGKDYGGNGLTFNWDILENMKDTFILAGGLSNENIQEALTYNPVIVDVNSKVEKDNRKNIELVKKVIEIVKK